ncbi:hypothetical protein GOV14_02940 [Candidatus Pacearchaeota archaeon]|nr:hypothetical protein [Candidatus Pacearchaeota archaeon]
MLDEWIKVLGKEKDLAIEKVNEASSDKKLVGLATHAIEVNFVSAKDWLKEMDNRGYKLEKDLSKVEKYSEASQDYRRVYNHVEYHMHAIRIIPLQVEEGKFDVNKFSHY